MTEKPQLAGEVFLEKLGRALHRFGSPAHRLEDALTAVAQPLGIKGQFFSTPTAIFADFASAKSHRTVLLRVEPGEVDLSKLSRLDKILVRVIAGELSPSQASKRVDEILAEGSRYGAVLSTLAFALVSASAARFLGGGWRECVAALGIGLLIGLLARTLGRLPTAGRIFELLSAVLAAFCATLAAEWAGASPYVVIVAGLIALIPGFTLTVAMNELATRHLVSGSARLAGATLIFLILGFGVALGTRLAEVLSGASPPLHAPLPLPPWTEALGLLAAGCGFTVLFQARARDLGWILAACAVALTGGRWGAAILGPQLGAFLGAVLVGIAGNLFARLRNRPAAITQLPGLMLLVPGSIGFRGISSFLAADAMAGVQSAFTMALVAIALVTGLLMANVLLPPRKAL